MANKVDRNGMIAKFFNGVYSHPIFIKKPPPPTAEKSASSPMEIEPSLLYRNKFLLKYNNLLCFIRKR
ncbi:MAG: hypothetical protein JW841_17940 [Deltaproteobacteria bacterium]|nr:hypothetical protein [Deltaproteobacteria bacterium]